MKNLNTIRVFRYDERENLWSSHELKNVFITGTKESYTLSDTQDRQASYIMRVMGDVSCDIEVSDRIVKMPFEGDIPPEDAVTAVSVTRNDQGIRTSHTKILCK